MEQIKRTLISKDIIRDYLATAMGATSIDDDLDIFESGIVNSLFTIQLVTFLEKQFGFKVLMEDMEMNNYNSINNIDAFVNRKITAI